MVDSELFGRDSKQVNIFTSHDETKCMKRVEASKLALFEAEASYRSAVETGNDYS